MSRTRVVVASDTHQALHKDVAALLSKYADKLTAAEVLAIMGVIVGQTIALQDQTAMTGDQAMDIVLTNIEQGNAAVINTLREVGGTMQ